MTVNLKIEIKKYIDVKNIDKNKNEPVTRKILLIFLRLFIPDIRLY